MSTSSVSCTVICFIYIVSGRGCSSMVRCRCSCNPHFIDDTSCWCSGCVAKSVQGERKHQDDHSLFSLEGAMPNSGVWWEE